MRLLVDIGNTRTKYTVEQQGKLSVIQTKRNEDINQQWLENITFSVKTIIIASVSEEHLVDVFLAYAKKNSIEFFNVESESKRFGVTSSYQAPRTLGVDRWLTLLAANFIYSNENILIVDAGTATTIDLLDKSGKHLGGWILPGIDILFNSLLLNTSQILATKENHVDIIQLLLQIKDIDINYVNHIRKYHGSATALTEAIDYNNVAAINLLLQHPKINLNYVINDKTPLIKAIDTGNNAIVKLLLQHPNIDPNMLMI